MPLAEYLASEQAREDVRLVVAKPHDVLRYSGNGGPWLERTTLKAWTRLGIEGADQYITAYYRPDGDRYVVTDLGEGVRALRLRTGILSPKTKSGYWNLITQHTNAANLPDAICRVMLVSLRVAEAVL